MRALLFPLGLVLLAGCASATQPSPAPDPAPGSATPARPVMHLPVAEELAIGNLGARVAVVVISDFQCPYCRRLHQHVLPAVKSRYVDNGSVRLYHKDLPLPMHKQAFGAAVAARCAARQGRLAQMQDALYGAAALNPSIYPKAASAIALDATAFEACMHSPSTRAVINRDRMEVRRLGVTSTPTVVLGYVENGVVRVERMATGIPTVEQFSEEIDALLRR